MASLDLKLATHHGAVVVMAASIRQQASAAISRMFRSPLSKKNAALLIEQRKQSLYAAYLEQLLNNCATKGTSIPRVCSHQVWLEMTSNSGIAICYARTQLYQLTKQKRCSNGIQHSSYQFFIDRSTGGAASWHTNVRH